MKVYNKNLFILILSIVSITSFVFIALNIYDLKKFKESYFNSMKKELISLKKEELKDRIDRLNDEFSVLNPKDFRGLINYINKFNLNNNEYIFVYKISKDYTKAKVLAIKESPVRKIGQIVDLNKKENLIWKNMVLNMIKTKKYSLFQKYKFINPENNRKEEKIAYFRYNPQLRLFLGQGIYLSDIYNFIYDTQKDYEAKLYKFILISILTFLTLIVILFFILYKYINHLVSELYKLNNEFKEKLIEQEAKLIHNYTHDDLTNFPNRNHLLDNIDKIKTLILIDIDMFGTINDIYGIEIGNFILKEVAKKIENYFKKYKEAHKIYRIGSDEFAIAFFEEVKFNQNEIEELINTCKHSTFKIFNLEINIDITIGVASSTNDILTKADLALRYAKKHN